MYNSGWVPSKIDGTEQEFIAPKNMGLPKEFSYKKYLPEVLNQGQGPICVPCSLSCNINWKLNLQHGKPKDNKIDLFDIFNSRTTDGEGMTFKEAFQYLIDNGVDTKEGKFKITSYARVGNIQAVKFALLANGPLVGVLPVYNSDSIDEFWNEKFGGFEGYHAVAIVGYTEQGLIIRNSWGEAYAEDGYALLLNKDINLLREVWTIY